MYRAFREARLAKHIGGFNTAHGYYYTFRHRGKTGRTHGQPGDIVVYNHGGHVGIYLGHGKVISALLSGVKVHPLQGINIRFTTFIHLGLTPGCVVHRLPGQQAQLPESGSFAAAARRAGSQRTCRWKRSPRAGDCEVLATSDRGHRGVWIKVRLSNGDKGWARKSLTRKIQPRGRPPTRHRSGR